MSLIGWIFVTNFIFTKQHFRSEEKETKSHCIWRVFLSAYVRALKQDLQLLVVCSGLTHSGFCSLSLKNLWDFHLRCAQCATEESGHCYLSLVLLRVSTEKDLQPPSLQSSFHGDILASPETPQGTVRLMNFIALLQDGNKHAQEALVFLCWLQREPWQPAWLQTSVSN